jgi:hypothetical protein
LVAAKLTANPAEPVRSPLWRAWLRAYLGVWTLTLSAGFLVAVTEPLRPVLRALLALRLDPAMTAAPRMSRALVLAAHNIPICCWPLLLGVLGAHRSRRGRRAADALVAVWLAVNVLPVGAAIGLYGTRLAAYVPQLPLEWAAVALGTAGGMLQRHHPLTVKTGLAAFALAGLLLVCAGLLETFAVPHS